MFAERKSADSHKHVWEAATAKINAPMGATTISLFKCAVCREEQAYDMPDRYPPLTTAEHERMAQAHKGRLQAVKKPTNVAKRNRSY